MRTENFFAALFLTLSHNTAPTHLPELGSEVKGKPGDPFCAASGSTFGHWRGPASDSPALRPAPLRRSHCCITGGYRSNSGFTALFVAVYRGSGAGDHGACNSGFKETIARDNKLPDKTELK